MSASLSSPRGACAASSPCRGKIFSPSGSKSPRAHRPIQWSPSISGIAWSVQSVESGRGPSCLREGPRGHWAHACKRSRPCVRGRIIGPHGPPKASWRIGVGYRCVWEPWRTWSRPRRRRWPHPWRQHGAMSTSNRWRLWTQPGGVKGHTARGCGRRSRPGSRGWSCGCRAVARWPRNSWEHSCGGVGHGPLAWVQLVPHLAAPALRGASAAGS